jgi:hypothetical protein
MARIKFGKIFVKCGDGDSTLLWELRISWTPCRTSAPPERNSLLKGLGHELKFKYMEKMNSFRYKYNLYLFLIYKILL